MPMPALTARKGDLLRDGIYVAAAVKADPDTAADVGLIAADQHKLDAAVVARREADTVAIEAGALADHRLGVLRREIVAFGVKAFGHFGSRSAAGYVRIFAAAPSQIIATSGDARARAFDAVRKAAADKETPKELAEAAKALEAAFKAHDAAAASDAKAAAALRAAIDAEDKAADGWHTAVRRLRGRLIMLFPRDSARVNGYLPPARKGSKSAKPAAGGAAPA